MNDAPRLTKEEAERFLFEEAELLDTGRLDEWLDLFTHDARYRLPITLHGNPLEPALIDDDRERMEERVFRLTSTQAHAQLPPSQTIHAVTNVRVEDLLDGDVLVCCNLVVHEVRLGGPEQVGLGQRRILPGRAQYVVAVAGDGPLRIRSKTVFLLERELPLSNIAFVV